jgi:hypothetical protein
VGATDLRPVAYPPETILTTDDLARWLQVSPRLVEAMHLPKLQLPGSRMVRYSAGQVLRYLESGKAQVA